MRQRLTLSGALTRARHRASHVSPLVGRVVDEVTGFAGLAPQRPLSDPPAGSGLRPIMGGPGLPIVGAAHQMLFSNGEYWARIQFDEFGPMGWMKMLGETMVGVMGVDEINEIYANRDKAFSNELGWGYVIGDFWHGGLMLMDGKEHLRDRRIMQQGFTRDRLAGYLEQTEASITHGIRELPTGRRIHLFPRLKQLTLDLASEVFLGISLHDERTNILNRAFSDAVRASSALVRVDVPGSRWHAGHVARRQLDEFFARELPAKRTAPGADLFSVLCEAESDDGQRFTDQQVIDHMIFLLMAAHDTSTATLVSVCHRIAREPVWQERLRAESRAIGDRHLTYDDLDHMPTYDMVIAEAQRLMTPVPVTPRRVVKDTSIGGHHLPEGVFVVPGVRGMHRNPAYWPDPDRFDPERFLPERAHEHHPNAFMPFGGGVHKCIGMFFGLMEVKAILHRLLLTHEIHVRPGYDMPVDWVSLPVPADGLPVRLEPVSARTVAA